MKKSVLISLVLIVLGAGMVAYAKCAASSSDSVPVKVEQRLREKAQAGKAYDGTQPYVKDMPQGCPFGPMGFQRRFREVCQSLCSWIWEK